MSTSQDFASTSPAPYADSWFKSHALDYGDLLDWKVQTNPVAHRFQIPVYSITGKLAFILDRNFDYNPKYSVQPPGSRRGFMLYGLHKHITQIRQNNFVVAVEGFSDLLSISKAGITNSVSLLGSVMTEVQYAMMTALADEVCLWMDGDDAGTMEASEASLRHEHVTGVVVTGLDPAEFVAAGGNVDKVVNTYLTFHETHSFLHLNFHGHLVRGRRR